MPEYIEREIVLEALQNSADHYAAIDQCTEEAIRMCMRTIQKIPAADVVEVVRCRECKRRAKSADLSNAVLCRWLHNLEMPKNGFCSYGEKEATND